MWEHSEWNDYVKDISRGQYWSCFTPEGVMEYYHQTVKRLTSVRERLKNPVSLKGGGPLQPTTIRQYKNQEKELIQTAANYRQLIKCLVKYNLLPTNKLISGEDRRQFVFSLLTMLELPELGKAVYHANRLTGSRYDDITPSTNEDYAKRKSQPGICYREKEEQSRESMYDALITSLNEAVQKLKKERQRFLFEGNPWKPKNNDSGIARTEATHDHCEKEVKHNDKIFKVYKGGLSGPREVIGEGT